MEFENLKNCLEQLLRDYHTPGVDCMVFKDHELLFRQAAGVRDLETGKPMDGEELYLIFSMTKMLTCTAALQLWETGKYGLDDPIPMYLPEFSKMRIADHEFDADAAVQITTGASAGAQTQAEGDGWAKNAITVRHLFTMCGGLDYDIGSAAIQKARAEGKTTTRELMDPIAQTVLGFEPGARFRYSLCHDVLGALIEVWSGMQFGQYMKEHVFEPLGMKNTFFGIPENQERLAALYCYNAQRQPEKIPAQCPYILASDYESGGAGLTSCTEDYGVFLDALACGGAGRNGARILQPETVALMGTNQLAGRPLADFQMLRPGYGYGLGVRVHIDPARSGSLSPVGEFGWDGAAGAFSMVDPANHLSMVYFQHVHNWDIAIQHKLRNALYQDLTK